MTEENVLYYLDEGVKIILNVGVDISDSTAQKIKFKRPNRTSGLWDAERASSTSISYIIQEDDLNYVGIWKLQAYVETPNWKLHGEEASLQVLGIQI